MKIGLRFMIAVALTLSAANAWAMPMFARRYNMECSACHNPIPRLNEAGYKFRAAGFRLPSEIGKSASPNKWGEFASARIQMRLLSNHSKKAASAKAVFDTTGYANSNQLDFFEVTFYPLTMSFGKYWSSLVELSNEADGVVEVENAYLRYDAGKEDQFYSIRGGVMHPFEGFGASDRPISIARPLFEGFIPSKTTPFYTIWGVDQMGIEGGLEMGKTSIRATVFNGTLFKADEGKIVGAVGGAELAKPAGPSSNSKDFQAYFNQILDEEGGGISALIYHGTLDQARPDDEGTFKNGFTRVAGFASYPVGKKLSAQAGVEMGSDAVFDGATKAVADTSRKSFGFFGSADYAVSENCWLGARYDMFNPNTGGKDNKVTAMTAFANIPLDNGVQFIAQYQYRQNRKGARYSDADVVKQDVSHNFEVRTIVIW